VSSITLDFAMNRRTGGAWTRDKQKAEEQKKLHEALNAEARKNWNRPDWHRQVAADLEEVFDYGFYNENLFGQYIQVENVGEFDRPVIEERRGLKVFSTSRGGYIDESTMTSKIMEVPRDTMGFHVSEHEDKLRANFGATIATLVDKGQARMTAEVNRRILSLAQAAIPSSSAYYVATTGLVKSELDAAIRGAQDAIKPDQTGDVPVTILGRASMLDQIADFDGFSNQPIYGPDALEEMRRMGFLGSYKGCHVIKIKNYADEDGVAFTNANEMWVLGGNAGKFVFYGGIQVKTWVENEVDRVHYRARRDTGGILFDPSQIRRLIDSSVAA
jgi:hypothetical protein